MGVHLVLCFELAPPHLLSHALDCQLFHLDPSGHHDTNVLFHALNAALLFWVLWRATGYAGRSFMVAALFALHPMNVESVAWVSERKNVLSMFFFLLALGSYRWYALKPRIDRYLAVAALYALGLMAKPQVITFPCVLLLWDYWPLQRMFAPANDLPATAPGADRPCEKSRLADRGEVATVRAFRRQRRAYRQGSGSEVAPSTALSLPIRLPSAWRTPSSPMCAISKRLFWPAHLAVYYPHPENLLNPWQVAGAAALLLAITALVVAGRRRRYLLAGWALGLSAHWCR